MAKTEKNEVKETKVENTSTFTYRRVIFKSNPMPIFKGVCPNCG